MTTVCIDYIPNFISITIMLLWSIYIAFFPVIIIISEYNIVHVFEHRRMNNTMCISKFIIFYDVYHIKAQW